MIEAIKVQAIKMHLFSGQPNGVFTILDGASVPDLPANLGSFAPECICLYRGELEPDLAEVAPYLVMLEQDAPFTDWVIANGWGNHWGIFGTAQADLRTLRKHFRMLLIVYDQSGSSLCFRYYDPRVWRAYLPSCNAEELSTIFGPVSSYLVENEGEHLSCFSRATDKLAHVNFQISSQEGQTQMLKIRNDQLEKLRHDLLCHDDTVNVTADAPLSRSNSLHIRNAQLTELENEMLVCGLLNVLTDVFPEDPPVDSPEFRIVLGGVIAKAANYAIAEDIDIARYACLAYLLGTDFDTAFPAAQSILVDETHPADERLTLVEFLAEQILNALDGSE